METSTTDALGSSRLLSLPKELRLEIWTYALIDATIDRVVIRVYRMLPGHCTPDCNSGIAPQAGTSFDRKGILIGVDILRTNRFVYEEALSILYRSVRFHPHRPRGHTPKLLEQAVAICTSTNPPCQAVYKLRFRLLWWPFLLGRYLCAVGWVRRATSA
jgi:hypothetical protein